jgi:hypothetical protein
MRSGRSVGSGFAVSAGAIGIELDTSGRSVAVRSAAVVGECVAAVAV